MNRGRKTLMVLTWCDADNIVNYGQILQGCAMAKIFSKLGYGKTIVVSYRARTLKQQFEYLWLHHIPTIQSGFSYQSTARLVKNVMKQCGVEFYQVCKKQDVDKIAERADVLVCGSDQIWHPVVYDSVYFLDIGKKSAHRISYAASQPMKQIYPEYKKAFSQMKHHLTKFDAISVREAGTVPMFEKMSKKPVVNVVDPTLLISAKEWEEHIEPFEIPKQFILMYIPAQMNKLAKDIIKVIRDKTGIKNVICLAPRSKQKIDGVTNLQSISTGRFLYLVKNASYVCTSSFHGVIFSTIFEKEFWCFKWMFVDRRGDLRLNQITEWTGLQRRLIKDIKELDIKDTIDYNEVKRTLSEHVKRSHEYIESNL